MRPLHSAALVLLTTCSGTALAGEGTPAVHRHLTATRATGPIDVDGALDEADWKRAPASGDFVQVDPDEGKPATLPTTVWVLFDDQALYLAARCEDPEGTAGIQQADLKRDFDSGTSDSLGFTLDTLADGRNAFGFFVNPYGAQKDLQVVDDQLYEDRWDTVWRSAVKRDAHGYTVELAIPWRSLRTRPGMTSLGFQVARSSRRTGEASAWNPYPRAFSAFRMSHAGVLDGLTIPPPRLLDVQLRPYAIVRVDRKADGSLSPAPEFGGELTWQPTTNSVLDVTANTDFAETDVDRRVVNLSRFSVYLPERRQFFLESAGLFDTGGGTFMSPFFSRTIGLSPSGTPLPIIAGARFVSRSLDHNFGGLLVQTGALGDDPASLFGVARYSHNLGDESRAGGMLVVRHDFAHTPAGGPALVDVTNVVPTLDGLYRNGPLSVSAFLSGSTTVAQDATPATFGASGHLTTELQGNWGYFSASVGGLSRDFDARAGFIGRSEIAGANSYLWLDHRPSWRPSWLRSITQEASAYSLWNSTSGRFEEAYVSLTPLGLMTQQHDYFFFNVDRSVESLTADFAPVPGVTFVQGDYRFDSYGLGAFTDTSRMFSVGTYASVGHYYRSDWYYFQGKVGFHPLPHVSLAAQWQYNHFSGDGVQPGGAENHLVLAEGRLALSPKLQAVASFQRDTAGDVRVINARLAWEFLPLSFIYLVFTDTRNALPLPAGIPPPPPEQRVVAKVTYTWRP